MTAVRVVENVMCTPRRCSSDLKDQQTIHRKFLNGRQVGVPAWQQGVIRIVTPSHTLHCSSLLRYRLDARATRTGTANSLQNSAHIHLVLAAALALPLPLSLFLPPILATPHPLLPPTQHKLHALGGDMPKQVGAALHVVPCDLM